MTGKAVPAGTGHIALLGFLLPECFSAVRIGDCCIAVVPADAFEERQDISLAAVLQRSFILTTTGVDSHKLVGRIL